MLEVFDCIMAEYTVYDWQCLDRPCAAAYKEYDHRVVMCVENILRTYGRIENAEQLRVLFAHLDANLEPKELGR
jgi:hypothetical protein